MITNCRANLTIFACMIPIALAGSSCASANLRSGVTESGIRAAEAVGAAEVPQAALHLQLAKEELGRAQKLHSQGARQEASSMLRRAEVDAELAIAISNEDAERKEAKDAIARINELRQ